MPIETLPVESFQDFLRQWTEIGASPWLDAVDFPTNYLRNRGLASEGHHYFVFQDSIHSEETIIQVILKVYTKMMLSEAETKWLIFGLYIAPSLWLYNLVLGTDWAWLEADVTDKLDTWAKINAVRGQLYGHVSSLSQFTEYLNVDGFVEVVKGWGSFGASPWLDAGDYPTAYVLTATDEAVIHDFTFENLVGELGLLQSLDLRIRCMGDGDDELIPSISNDNGSTWNELAPQAPPTSMGYRTWDVSSYLDTKDKINNARLKLKYNKVKGGATMIVDWARLQVTHKNYCLADAAKLEVEYTTVVAKGIINKFSRKTLLPGLGR